MVRPLLAGAVLVLLTSGCAYTVHGTPVAGPLPPVPTVGCTYVDTSGEPNTKAVEPPPGAEVPSAGRVVLRLDTALGELEFTLEAAFAPCSVHSFRHLAEQRLYDGNSCHRLVTSGIWIVQCGDPTPSGVGGPGYRYDDPGARTGGYGRGVIGMANRATAGTNGSQFFIVYKDSEFPPDYPVIGEVSRGMDVIDRVAAGGVVPVAGESDGKPVTELKFTEVVEK
ncbi:peptidylprolyl isomerase [Actinosynnema sp. NPDC023587]|uniref:peptidylprolyl isomerase n=1 Tax=Actinosynnema sp. NPDC023587 TaxID=3154695 RepID=UPI0033E77B6E